MNRGKTRKTVWSMGTRRPGNGQMTLSIKRHYPLAAEEASAESARRPPGNRPRPARGVRTGDVARCRLARIGLQYPRYAAAGAKPQPTHCSAPFRDFRGSVHEHHHVDHRRQAHESASLPDHRRRGDCDRRGWLFCVCRPTARARRDFHAALRPESFDCRSERQGLPRQLLGDELRYLHEGNAANGPDL